MNQASAVRATAIAPSTTSADRRAATSALVDELRRQREAVAEAFAEALSGTPKWAQTMRDARSDWPGFIDTHFVALADYLIEHFARGEDSFKHLLVGERIKNEYDPGLDARGAKTQTLAVNEAESQLFDALLRERLPAPAWSLFSEVMKDVHRLVGGRDASKTQRLLLIGDCVFLDIVPFAVGELLDAGVSIVPHYATSKNPLELRDELRKLAAQKFDLVFFSPFSYEFTPDYARLAEWRQGLHGRKAVEQVVSTVWQDTRLTLDLVADLFDCPVHVHNSSAVIREESEAKRRAKLAVTARIRALARSRMNGLLAEHVARKNAESFRHVFILDENALVQAAGEVAAGAFFYRTALQHPAVFGQIVAKAYVDLIVVNAWLLKKKLVVCDLDNTLWEGTIGEGAVSHFSERQQILIALKRKGVVLAICSKNDPANVHWSGGTLKDDDFVCAAISWGPKVDGMKRIQSVLNLKMKDYIFVDDREDELELVKLTYPDILCMDATAPATWRRFQLWSELLDEDPEMDRTLMYRQREERKAFIKEDVSSDEEKAALFASLELTLTITQARSEDLKRVAELINRTNQFNLEGSRTTFVEVSEWHRSAQHVILTGQTADRFGDMGTTCVAVARIAGTTMTILPFVLSCRVFGYGIERGVLNHLKRLAEARGATTITANYVATPQNGPSEHFLSENGFRRESERWSFDVGGPAIADMSWLAISTPA